MTKHISYGIVLFLVLALTTVSCKNAFLEVVPKGQQVASALNDYELLMNSPIHYDYAYAGGWQVPAMLGDEIAAEENNYRNAGVINQRLFRWDAVLFGPTEDAQDIRVAMTNTYRLNKIINEVMDAPDGSYEQKQSLRAEALATRAFNYFQLINVYAKPYDAATATTDPGFPVNTTADISKDDFNRGTVQSVYDFIISDLKEAIKALPVQQVIQTRVSKPAACALLAKVYLFMGKPEEALPLLNQAFTDMAAWQVPPQLYNYNITFGPNGSFLPIGPNGPVSPSATPADFKEIVWAKTFQNFTANGSSGIVLSPAAAALYSSSDLRLNFYTKTYPSGAPNPAGRLRKYGVQYSRFGIGLADMYLLRAECKARSNDFAGAVADVQLLRNNRMPVADAAVPAPVANDKVALISFILDERIREFALEGHRWFDMRRLSVDPLFKGKAFTHTLYLAAGGTEVYTLQQPQRLVLRIPPVILTANPGMPDNP